MALATAVQGTSPTLSTPIPDAVSLLSLSANQVYKTPTVLGALVNLTLRALGFQSSSSSSSLIPPVPKTMEAGTMNQLVTYIIALAAAAVPVLDSKSSESENLRAWLSSATTPDAANAAKALYNAIKTHQASNPVWAHVASYAIVASGADKTGSVLRAWIGTYVLPVASLDLVTDALALLTSTYPTCPWSTWIVSTVVPLVQSEESPSVSVTRVQLARALGSKDLKSASDKCYKAALALLKSKSREALGLAIASTTAAPTADKRAALLKATYKEDWARGLEALVRQALSALAPSLDDKTYSALLCAVPLLPASAAGTDIPQSLLAATEAMISNPSNSDIAERWVAEWALERIETIPSNQLWAVLQPALAVRAPADVYSLNVLEVVKSATVSSGTQVEVLDAYIAALARAGRVSEARQVRGELGSNMVLPSDVHLALMEADWEPALSLADDLDDPVLAAQAAFGAGDLLTTIDVAKAALPDPGAAAMLGAAYALLGIGDRARYYLNASVDSVPFAKAAQLALQVRSGQAVTEDQESLAAQLADLDPIAAVEAAVTLQQLDFANSVLSSMNGGLADALRARVGRKDPKQGGNVAVPERCTGFLAVALDSSLDSALASRVPGLIRRASLSVIEPVLLQGQVVEGDWELIRALHGMLGVGWRNLLQLDHGVMESWKPEAEADVSSAYTIVGIAQGSDGSAIVGRFTRSAVGELNDPVLERTAQGKLSEVLCEHSRILKESLSTTARGLVVAQDQRGKWWKTRRNLDERVQAVAQKLHALVPSLYDSQEPVILVLDRAIWSLPWESASPSSVITRLPAVEAIRVLEKKRCDQGARPKPGYYVINPGKDLVNTESVVKSLVDDNNWEGVSGAIPLPEEVLLGMQSSKVYLYAGHGAGATYVPPARVAAMSSPPPPSLLMGCSSVATPVPLSHSVGLEPQGPVWSYLVGGSPAVVGALWDVTDKDLDKLTNEVLTNWKDPTNVGQLLEALAAGRKVTKLEWINAAAMVVYGLPA